MVLGPALSLQILPAAWQGSVARTLQRTDLSSSALVIWLILALIDVGLLVAAMTRFRRLRLILEN
jgi:hypothetical protein